ncbi:MAG: DUF3333 domain-containing protein, partial [Dongiaceae bacterium]
MTEIAQQAPAVPARRPDLSEARIRRRYAAERRFRLYGALAIGTAVVFLAVLLFSIVSKGYSAFYATYVGFDVTFDPAVIDPQGTKDPAVIGNADFNKLARDNLQAKFPDATSRQDRRALADLVSSDTQFILRNMVLADPSLIGRTVRVWVPASDDADMLNKGFIPRDVAEAERRISDKQIGWFDALAAAGQVETRFNTTFFSNADSREPEQAGVWGAVVGTILTMFVTLTLCLPLGVATALYLEEFAAKNKWTDLIEVNINNLAAVPSIVFGLLGLALFLGFFGLPRSAPLVGGMVLSLMTLPTMIIVTRAALKAVPPSIREAALAVGASRMQT